MSVCVSCDESLSRKYIVERLFSRANGTPLYLASIIGFVPIWTQYKNFARVFSTPEELFAFMYSNIKHFSEYCCTEILLPS